MFDKIIQETYIDILEAMSSSNPEAREEFLRDPRLERPDNRYERLDREKAARNIEQIEAALDSAEFGSLDHRDQMMVRMSLDLNLKRNKLMLYAWEWNHAAPEKRAEVEQLHRAMNRELYGEPDPQVFHSLLAMLLDRIDEKALQGEEVREYDELLALLPVIPKEHIPPYIPAPESVTLLSELVAEFYSGFFRHIPGGKTFYTVQEAADIVNEILKQEIEGYGDKWTAFVEPHRASAASIQENMTIAFPGGRANPLYTLRELKAIIVHELGVHALRAMTYQEAAYRSLFYGMPGYESVEEGIAKVMEQGVSGAYSDSGVMHYISIGLICLYKKNFRETFEIQKRLQGLSGHHSEKVCFNSVQRALRGTDVLPFSKDMVYYNGAVKVWEYVEKHLDDPELFDHLLLSAKTDIFDPDQRQLVYEAKTGYFDRVKDDSTHE